MGEARPTIVVDVGAGNWSVHWAHLQQRLGQHTRTCLYDRAGFGWSDPGPLPRSGERVAAELRELLARAGERPPYVMVGHSYGGWIARIYQRLFPAEVSALALVEAAHERQWSELPAQVRAFVKEGEAFMAMLVTPARFGLLRAQRSRLAKVALPSPEKQAQLELWLSRSRHYRAMLDTFASIDQVAGAAGASTGVGDLPLLVVSAARSFEAFRTPDGFIPIEQADAVWDRLQAELARLSTRGRRVVSPGATHNIHLDDPDLIEREVVALVQLVRSELDAASR